MLERALEQGHDVTAFVRDPSTLDAELVRVANGNAREIDDLKAAMTDRDCVIDTIGGGERKLIEQTTRALIEAMNAVGIRRVVAMSTFLITPNYKPTGMMRLFPRLLRGMTADDRAGMEMLAESRLDWTIVFATLLKNGPAVGYRIVGPGEAVTGKSRINRADVADCLLTVAGDPRTVGQSLLVTGS